MSEEGLQPVVQAEWDHALWNYFYNLNYMQYTCRFALKEINNQNSISSNLEIEENLRNTIVFLMNEHKKVINRLKELCSRYPQYFIARASEMNPIEHPELERRLFDVLVETSVQHIDETDEEKFNQKNIEIDWNIYYAILRLDQCLCATCVLHEDN